MDCACCASARRTAFDETLARLGHIPLPPYIKREDEPLDRERYQTVFARQGSAVAAPTAGLHFTPEILGRLRDRGIEIAELTLDVGLGTFEPVRTERLEDHKIHAEAYEIPEATVAAIERARRASRPVLAVGTTVVRALEDAAEKSAGRAELLAAGKAEADNISVPRQAFSHRKSIADEFSFAAIELCWRWWGHLRDATTSSRAYRHAVESGYRFYSYGDAMLIR